MAPPYARQLNDTSVSTEENSYQELIHDQYRFMIWTVITILAACIIYYLCKNDEHEVDDQEESDPLPVPQPTMIDVEDDSQPRMGLVHYFCRCILQYFRVGNISPENSKSPPIQNNSHKDQQIPIDEDSPIVLLTSEKKTNDTIKHRKKKCATI